ncbi:hypothetical protein POTOM_003561 [Populus tomentosa]|uniref:Uncharacterized protein n=1 Tax=Populus tomentosa TaxID=118781 RepID=A0A8X8DLX8_POPTO|nr:hypothetical protein POTOM_003561 [Populus tomentosa]
MASNPKTQTPKANTTPSTTKHPTNQHQNTQKTASPTSTRTTPPSGFWADKIRVTDSNTRCTLDPIPRKPVNSDASPSHQVKGNASPATNTDDKQLNVDASTSHQDKGNAITSLATNTDEMSSEELDSSGETDTNSSDETNTDESASDSSDESQLKPSDLGDVNPITPPLSTNNHVRTSPLELPMCITSKQMALPSSSETSSSSQVPPINLPKMTPSRAHPPESIAQSVGCDDIGFTLVTRRKKKKDIPEMKTRVICNTWGIPLCAVEMQILIQLIMHCGSAIASKPAIMNSQLTVSKAFLKSIFKAQLEGPLLRWELKADCAGPIISFRAIFSLDTMILEMHLYRILQQEIGRKSFMEDGFSTFGTRATLVALTQRIENRAALISSLVGGRSIDVLDASDIVFGYNSIVPKKCSFGWVVMAIDESEFEGLSGGRGNDFTRKPLCGGVFINEGELL